MSIGPKFLHHKKQIDIYSKVVYTYFDVTQYDKETLMFIKERSNGYFTYVAGQYQAGVDYSIINHPEN